jgi:hypothetical protein
MKRWLLSLLCALLSTLFIYTIWGAIISGLWGLLLMQILMEPTTLVVIVIGLMVFMFAFRYLVFKQRTKV